MQKNELVMKSLTRILIDFYNFTFYSFQPTKIVFKRNMMVLCESENKMSTKRAFNQSNDASGTFQMDKIQLLLDAHQKIVHLNRLLPL